MLPLCPRRASCSSTGMDCWSMDCDRKVPSSFSRAMPTFTIVRQHECLNDLGITTLHHADVYRVGSLGEVDDLALGELVEESAVALVEWGEIATALFGLDVITVSFAIDHHEGRTIEVDGALATREELLDTWAAS